jgi:hypothetical protein
MEAACGELPLDLALMNGACHVVVECVRHVRVARAVNEEQQTRIPMTDADDPHALAALPEKPRRFHQAERLRRAMVIGAASGNSKTG